MKATDHPTPIRPAAKPGARFGRWTVLQFYGFRVFPSSNQQHPIWLCRCDCGNEKPVLERNLHSGHSRSCGCLSKDQARENIKQAIYNQVVHGEARPATVEYIAWTSMLQRCYNPNEPHYKDYGGRGITVCDRWRHDYSAFLADMGRRPSNDHSLNRVNNDGNYDPNNCEWSLWIPQSNNKRNTIIIGGTPLADLARKYNIPRKTLWSRLFVLKWDLEKAITQPVVIRAPNPRR